jgi:hypothetical protein
MMTTRSGVRGRENIHLGMVAGTALRHANGSVQTPATSSSRAIFAGNELRIGWTTGRNVTLILRLRPP